LTAAKTHGVIGSSRITNEESFVLQKFARQGLKTPHIDHRRSADFPALMDALTGRDKALATSGDVRNAKTVILIGNNPTDQHPLLAWNIRTAMRLDKQHLYIVNRARIQLFDNAAETQIVNAGGEIAALDAWKESSPRKRRRHHLWIGDQGCGHQEVGRIRRHAAWNNKVHRAR